MRFQNYVGMRSEMLTESSFLSIYIFKRWGLTTMME